MPPLTHDGPAEASPQQVGIAVAFTALVLFAVLLLKVDSFQKVERYDFSVRYASGLILRSGYARQLYDVREQARIQQQLFPGRGFMADFHPPFEALLYAPLTRRLPKLDQARGGHGDMGSLTTSQKKEQGTTEFLAEGSHR